MLSATSELGSRDARLADAFVSALRVQSRRPPSSSTRVTTAAAAAAAAAAVSSSSTEARAEGEVQHQHHQQQREEGGEGERGRIDAAAPLQRQPPPHRHSTLGYLCAAVWSAARDADFRAELFDAGAVQAVAAATATDGDHLRASRADHPAIIKNEFAVSALWWGGCKLTLFDPRLERRTVSNS